MASTGTYLWNKKLLIGAIAALGATTAQAVPTTYTSRAAFDAAIAAIVPAVNQDVLDFDSTAAGTILPSPHQGVTFNYTPFGGGGYQIGVSDDFPGTSGPNMLRVSNDGGANFSSFIAGDQIDFDFAASHAFGMYIIPPIESFDFQDGDIQLTFAGTTLSNIGSESATMVGTVPALFVGIVDPSATHTTASLLFGFGPFDIDDIVKTSAVASVPEPTTLALMGLGMMGIALARRKNPTADK